MKWKPLQIKKAIIPTPRKERKISINKFERKGKMERLGLKINKVYKGSPYLSLI